MINFSKKYDPLFKDSGASKVFNQAFHERHKQMREQLADLINPVAPDRFTAEYVAEALLCWTMSGRSFDDIYELLPERIK